MKQDKLGLIRNLLAQAARPSRARVMLKKVWRRLADEKGLISREENLDWIRRHRTPVEQIANDIDPGLWSEAQDVSGGIAEHAREVLAGMDGGLRGAACCPLIYFAVRCLKPAAVVETGVAAGFSTSAILQALQRNGRGVLHSSDFPRFRLPDPEKLVGLVVPEPLRRRWHLYMEGDEANLPEILRRVDQVDMFHYDSDKSYSGRRFATELIQGRLSDQGVVLMDDIGGNSFFHDYVTSNGIASWDVLGHQGKCVGMIGRLAKSPAEG